MKMLIGYDGSTFADVAIDDLQKAGLPANVEALVICVADGGVAHPHGPTAAAAEGDASWRSMLEEAERLAEDASSRLGSHFPSWTISSEALWGSPAKALLDTTEWWHPDLLVVGSHGRSGVARLILGSVSLQLVCKAPCSVRVGRSTGANPSPLRIIIGNDGSDEARAVIRSVAARSWPANTEARIVSVVQTLAPVPTPLDANTYAHERAYSVICEADEHERHRLANVVGESEDDLRRAGLIVTSKVVEGDPREIIVSEAERFKAHTIFVGARGLGRVERLLLGSVSNYVVTHAPCSVEVVKPRHV